MAEIETLTLKIGKKPMQFQSVCQCGAVYSGQLDCPRCKAAATVKDKAANFLSKTDGRLQSVEFRYASGGAEVVRTYLVPKPNR